MIRILYLIDKLTPAGTQTNLLEIVKRLGRNRFEPRVIALVEGGSLLEEFRAAGVSTTVLETGRAYSPRALSTVAFLVQTIRREKMDVIQAHFLHADLLGTLAVRLAGRGRLIATRRDEGFWRVERQVFVNRFLNRFIDGMLVNSEAVRRAVIRDENLSPDQIRVVHNGVNVQRFFPDEEARRSVRCELGIRDGEVVIGVVANMRHSIKGHSYLIEAMPGLLKEVPHCRLVLVGEGELKVPLQLLAERLGVLEQTHFLGSRRDIPGILNAVDIGCLPSLSEGFSNFILECMATGKPVVACESGGNPEVIENGESGFLIPPADSASLAHALIRLAEDESGRASMGDHARNQILNGFTTQHMVEKYEDYYASLVDSVPSTNFISRSNSNCHPRML